MTASYDEVMTLLRQRAGLDLSHYRVDQMQRRVQNAMLRMGIKTLDDLVARATADRAVLQDLIDRLTVNVSEFFRNPELFARLERIVLPDLLKRNPRLRIWSAGCSYGAELYSLAILMRELAPAGGHTLSGTDIDATILQRAAEGRFSAADVRAVTPPRLSRHFAADGDGWRVSPELRAMVRFRKQNLLSDRFENGWHLICCRNVVIYFTEEAKADLYRRFYESLAPGGFLFIGATEQIFRAREIGFETPHPFLYRKPAGSKAA